MNVTPLEQIEQLIDIDVFSHEAPVVIFKHSTRCNISATALSRLDHSWKPDEMEHVRIYYLDLIAHRTTSNAVAEHYAIPHESPQVLIISKGACIYHESHLGITYPSLKEQVNKVVKP